MNGPNIVCAGCGKVTNNLFSPVCDECAAALFDQCAAVFANTYRCDQPKDHDGPHGCDALPQEPPR